MTSPGLAGASYVDTTALSAVVFGEEPVAESITRKLSGFRYLLSANLLEAEMRIDLSLRDGSSAMMCCPMSIGLCPTAAWTLKWGPSWRLHI